MPSSTAEAMHCTAIHALLTQTLSANDPAGFSL